MTKVSFIIDFFLIITYGRKKHNKPVPFETKYVSLLLAGTWYDGRHGVHDVARKLTARLRADASSPTGILHMSSLAKFVHRAYHTRISQPKPQGTRYHIFFLTREACSLLLASSSFCFSRLCASLILRCSSCRRSSSSFLSLSACSGTAVN